MTRTDHRASKPARLALVIGNVASWLRLSKKSAPTEFVQLSFLLAELEATLIQHRPGL
jgi:hypothetical protein